MWKKKKVGVGETGEGDPEVRRRGVYLGRES